MTGRRVTDLLARLAPARRRVVLGLAGIAVLAVLVTVLVLLVDDPGTETADQSRPGPVLVVPGYGGTSRDLAPLVEELRRQGRTVVSLEPTQGGTGDLRVQARRLADLAEQTLDRTGADSVDVVGYSAGGVITRLFVRDEGGAAVVRRVLTLGSPHHGTEVAALADRVAGGCPKACEQLVLGSDLLRRLNARDETPAGPRWITVRTDDDRTVTPTDSAELEGALNIGVQEICAGATTSHDDLPGDPVVLATLASVLGADTPRPPVDVTC